MSISFGLVSVPVSVYKTTDEHGTQFHQFHAGDCQGAIGRTATCKSCGEVVAYADIISGTEVNDKLVTISKDERDSIERDSANGIEVLSFVHADDMPPLMLRDAYYLAPTKESLEGYTLLRTVLDEANRVGIVRFALRNDAMHIGVLRVVDETLSLQKLVWPQDIRQPEFAILAKKIAIKPAMIKMAEKLVESMLGDFNPADYTDMYATRLTELVQTKACGGDFVATPHDNDSGGDVSDLLDKLEASVKARRAVKA
jgi:DNA end-binding protein Ku